jgi:hydroxymethylpyrimidine pyrophosphatase-like HAD family hydrolase
VAQTIAFGDGGNDITILRQAGVGVAMGNAVEEVKQNADFITTSVDEDGIRNALSQLIGIGA